MNTCVLLSTYNGQKYLREQLFSLECQTIVPKFLIVRDDGSSDDTFAILERFQKESGIETKIICGSNLGPERSFMELLKSALEVDAEVYFFCDQDDIWIEDKIENFVSVIGKVQSPHLVVSKVALVDSNNKIIGFSKDPRKIGFGNALIENIAIGCASGFNRSCLEIAVSREIIHPPMHDWWIYIVASLFGRVTYLSRPSVRYRQHDGNVVGAANSWFSSAKRRINRLFKPRGLRKTQISETVIDNFGDCIPEYHRKTCELISRSPHSLSDRLYLIFSSRCWRQTFGDEILWRIHVLIRGV